MPTTASSADVQGFAEAFSEALGSLVIGQPQAISHLAAALLCNGHVLLSGGAATAKRPAGAGRLAAVTGLGFRRIQFTPDLDAL